MAVVCAAGKLRKHTGWLWPCACAQTEIVAIARIGPVFRVYDDARTYGVGVYVSRQVRHIDVACHCASLKPALSKESAGKYSRILLIKNR